MSSLYTKKEFIRLLVPSLLVAIFVCGLFTLLEKQYEESKIFVGDTTEVVLDKFDRKPNHTFSVGEDEKMKEFLREGGYVLRDEVNGRYGSTIIDREDYGKILYAEDGKTVRRDPPPIIDQVYIFGDYVLDVFYINEKGEVTHIFTAGS